VTVRRLPDGKGSASPGHDLRVWTEPAEDVLLHVVPRCLREHSVPAGRVVTPATPTPEETVTASSYSRTTAQKAVDGDCRRAGRAWACRPSWIQVDLARHQRLSVVTTFEKSSGYVLIEYPPRRHLVRIRGPHSQSTLGGNYSFADQPYARYLRWSVTGSSWNGGSIYELQAYGDSEPSARQAAPAGVALPGTKARMKITHIEVPDDVPAASPPPLAAD